MSEYVSVSLRRLTRDRSDGCCEYCLIHEDDCLLPHEPDHIIAVKHRGETVEGNLAWTCFVCNRAKGTDIASIDDETGNVVRLFSPRQDQWNEHFSVAEDGHILPTTEIGRATVMLLRMNRPELLETRSVLMQANLYPTKPMFPRGGETG